MANVQTYNGLVSAVTDFIEDDSAETRLYMDTAIELAQLRMQRETDAMFMVSNATVSCTQGNRFLTKPNGYLVGQTLSYGASNGTQVMTKQSRSFCERYWYYAAASVGNPRFYADYSNTSFLLAPTPDANYGFNLAYTVRPIGISSANQTNLFSTNLGDALFHATCVEMARYSRNDMLIQQEEMAYVNAMGGALNENRRARRDEGLQPTNTNANLNTLKQDN